MTAADTRALAYSVYEAINNQDVATLEKLFHPNIVRHATGEVGIENARKAVINAFANSPGLRFVVEDVLAESDKAALRVTVHGIPVTPEQSQPMIMEIFRFENGRVVEIWGAGTARQPGA